MIYYCEWWAGWSEWSALSWKCQELLRIEIWPPLLWPYADHHLGAGQGVSWSIFDWDQKQLEYSCVIFGISPDIFPPRWGAPSIRPLAPLSLHPASKVFFYWPRCNGVHPASKVTSKSFFLWAFWLCLAGWRLSSIEESQWVTRSDVSLSHNYSSHLTKGARACKMYWYDVHPYYHCPPPHQHHHLGQVLHYAQEIYEGMKAYR